MKTKLKLADGAERAHEREINETEQKYRSICRDYDSDLAQVHTQYDNKCAELREALLKANMETACLKARLAVLEGEYLVILVKKGSAFSTNAVIPAIRKRGIVFLLACIVAIVGAVVAFHFNATSIDAFCGPARPGTIFLSHQEATMEAPWWAPNQIKEKAFFVFCRRRTRTRLVWSRGTLAQFSFANGESNKTPTWKRRAYSIQTGSNRVFLKNKQGRIFAGIETILL